jgi:expansin (peptidoglycan-binding protein)
MLIVLLLCLVALNDTLGSTRITAADDDPTPTAGENKIFLPLIVMGGTDPEPEQPDPEPKQPDPEPEQPDPEPKQPDPEPKQPDPTLLPGLPFDPTRTRTGEGTFYNVTDVVNCGLPVPADKMIGAMNNSDYANAWLCGAFAEVTGPKGTITVQIVDQCPECAPGDIDLSAEAFAKIAEPVQGRVDISWQVISPDISGPVVYHFKEGSNQWWTGIQIRNHRNPIHKVEYQDSSGQFREIPRESYNYFVADSSVGNEMGPGPYTLRITDIYGHTLTDSGINLVVAGDVPGSGQFPKVP